jgi:hypothetical protein
MSAEESSALCRLLEIADSGQLTRGRIFSGDLPELRDAWHIARHRGLVNLSMIEADPCWLTSKGRCELALLRECSSGTGAPAIDHVADTELPATTANAKHTHRADTVSDQAGTGEVKGRSKKKRKGGKPPLEESNLLKLQIYQRIKQEYQAGKRHAEIVERLKTDKDFVEQINDAGEKLNTKLVRKALAFFDQRNRSLARKNQETDSA